MPVATHMQQPPPLQLPQLQLDLSTLTEEQRQAVVQFDMQARNAMQEIMLETQAIHADEARLRQRCAELEQQCAVQEEEQRHQQKMAEIEAANERQIAEKQSQVADLQAQTAKLQVREAEMLEQIRTVRADTARADRQREQAAADAAQARADAAAHGATAAAHAAAQRQAEEDALARQAWIRLLGVQVQEMKGRLLEKAAGDVVQAREGEEAGSAAARHQAERASWARALAMVRQLEEELAGAGEQAGIQPWHEAETSCSAAHGQAAQASSQPAAAEPPRGTELCASLAQKCKGAVAEFFCLPGAPADYEPTVHSLISTTKQAILASTAHRPRLAFLSASFEAPGLAAEEQPTVTVPRTWRAVESNVAFTITRKVAPGGDTADLKCSLAEAARFFVPAADREEGMRGPAAEHIKLRLTFGANVGALTQVSQVHTVQLMWEGDNIVTQDGL